MVQALRMPMMGNTMESGLLDEWRVDEGDAVEPDEVVAVVESEKAAADVVADRHGTVARIDVEAGEEVAPGTLLGVVVGEDDDLADAPPPRDRIEPGEEGDPDPETSDAGGDRADGAAGGESPGDTAASGDVRAAPGARRLAAERDVDLAAIEGTGPDGAVTIADVEARLEGTDAEAEGGAGSDGDPGPDSDTAERADDRSRSFASPSTRRLARDLGVTIDDVTGSGIEGRVTESDVRAAAGAVDRTPDHPGDGAPAGGADASAGDPDRDRRDPEEFGVTVAEERELSPMRRTIADRMSRSARQAPHVTNKREIAVGRALDAAEDLSEEFDADVGLTDIIVAAVSRALAAHPEFNAWYESGRMRLVAEHNVAIAVDTDAGLVTPVIRSTEDRSIASVATERHRLTDSVLAGEYGMDDLRGGTFTITNLGMFGVDSFDPIINPPQVGILGVGRIRERDGERTCVLSLSFDHRAVDGADAARFLDTIAGGIESPVRLSAAPTSGEGRAAERSPDSSEAPGRSGREAIGAMIADDLQEQAREISATHGWTVPEFDVRVEGSVPSITVDAPDGTSPATMRRLTYAACRESEYRGLIDGLTDPDLRVA